jgi:hypothetical protein
MWFHKMMRELLDKHGKKFDMEEYHREQLAMMQKNFGGIWIMEDIKGGKQYKCIKTKEELQEEQSRIKQIDDRADREGWFYGD